MSKEEHPLDQLLRELAGSPTPRPGDRERGQAKLDAAIHAEKAGRRMRVGWGPVGWAAALIVTLSGVVALVQAGGSSPAEAAMGEVAEVAREVDPVVPNDDSFVYTSSEATALVTVSADGLGELSEDKQLLYLLPTLRESWFGSKNTVKIQSVALDPTFFSSADRDLYLAAGIDQQDQIGELTTSIVQITPETWPADRNELDAAIREQLVTDRGLPVTVEYLDVALDIVRESFASPDVRSATLDLIGSLDGLELGEPHPTDALAFYIEYSDQGVDVRYSFSIDNSGYLRSEEIRNLTADTQQGIPSDTAIFQAEYSAPVITESLDSPSG